MRIILTFASSLYLFLTSLSRNMLAFCCLHRRDYLIDLPCHATSLYNLDDGVSFQDSWYWAKGVLGYREYVWPDITKHERLDCV
jgi:hypothetical protein